MELDDAFYEVKTQYENEMRVQITGVRNRQLTIMPPMPFIPENMPGWASEEGHWKAMMSSRGFASNIMRGHRLTEYYKFQHGMFAFVCWDWVRPLARWIGSRRCLEVMAGRGFLSHALRKCSVNVIATDDYSWHRSEHQPWAGMPLMTDIEEMDAVDAVRKYGASVDFVIMSWAYMDNTSYNVVKELRNVNPKALIIHIGEGGGGCTDSDQFFGAVKQVNDKRFYEDVAPKYQTWQMLHDRLNLFRVRGATDE